MAQGFGMGKEVVQGIGITLVLIVICVVIGAQIAAATSHGPEKKEETVEKTEKADAPSADAKSDDAKADEAKADDKK